MAGPSGGQRMRKVRVSCLSMLIATLAGCELSVFGCRAFLPWTAARSGLVTRRVAEVIPRGDRTATARQAEEAATTTRKRTRKPTVRVNKLKKSKEGASESSVWEFIREKDKAALEEGAFMDTFAGQLTTVVVIAGMAALVLWEIYLNTLYPRKAPMLNIFEQQREEERKAYQAALAEAEAKETKLNVYMQDQMAQTLAQTQAAAKAGS
eukprot:gb/GFBE01065541.1/.p1 GENE.gb/GFBE01065541.1/~~gb/GFBE01065541.1/.p1  ORF type:complete len:209 (+),score=47.50 gb/GFBE01065541.1/:1-627(+)